VKKVAACVLFVLLGLALSGPTVAHARTISTQTEAQKKTQKNWKKAGKRQARAQKKQQKAQNKAAKKYNKNHPTRTTTT
jgi:hypothetical protein